MGAPIRKMPSSLQWKYHQPRSSSLARFHPSAPAAIELIREFVSCLFRQHRRHGIQHIQTELTKACRSGRSISVVFMLRGNLS
jgi:hypothetical protein